MLQYINCTTVDNQSLLQVDMYQICYQNGHLIFLLILCIPALVTFSVVLPYVQCRYLKQHRGDCLKRDETLSITRSCGLLFLPFENHYYWWAVFVLWRKVMFIVCLVVLEPFGQRVQSVLGFMVLNTAMVFHVRHKPYLHDDADLLESWSLGLTQGDF